VTKHIKRTTMKSTTIFNSDPKLDRVLKSVAKQIPPHNGTPINAPSR
jgi:hypothetical protein